MEKVFHDEFGPIRSHGEWFKPETQIFTRITNLREEELAFDLDQVPDPRNFIRRVDGYALMQFHEKDLDFLIGCLCKSVSEASMSKQFKIAECRVEMLNYFLNERKLLG